MLPSSKPKTLTQHLGVVAALLVLLMGSLPGPASGEPVANPDGSRIVSIGGAVTEILYALGMQDAVIGVDSTSLFPREAAAKQNLGYMRALSAEGVLALSPNLILMEDGSGPPETVNLLDAAGIDIVHVPNGHDVDGIGKKIRIVAGAVDKAAEGERLAATVEAGLKRLADDLTRIGEKRRVLFILSMADGRPMAAGSDTGADAIIELAGGTNVFAGAACNYPQVRPW